MSKSVSIVIPNWNGVELLAKNLPDVIKASENKKNKIKEIIVVDDKSTDDSVNFLVKNFKDKVKVVKHTKNRGFSSTVNTGVRSSKGELICLLNTDVIPSQDFLENVFVHFKNENVFGVSLHEQGYGYGIATFENGYVQLKPGQEKSQPTETFWVSGGSGVFRRDVWMKLGGLDEKLLSPFYWEDLDLCYRGHKRGYRFLWEPRARVIHKHESTVSKLSKNYVDRIRERNQLIFVWKNITSKRLFKKHIQGLFARVIKHPGYLRIVFLTLLKFGQIMKARRKEFKESLVSDEAIFAKFTK